MTMNLRTAIRHWLGPLTLPKAAAQLNKIIAETGVESIDIEDDGSVVITSLSGEAAKKAETVYTQRENPG